MAGLNPSPFFIVSFFYQISESSKTPWNCPWIILANNLHRVFNVRATSRASHAKGRHRKDDTAPLINAWRCQSVAGLKRLRFVQLSLENVNFAFMDSSQSSHFPFAFHSKHFLLLEFGFGPQKSFAKESAINLLFYKKNIWTLSKKIKSTDKYHSSNPIFA